MIREEKSRHSVRRHLCVDVDAYDAAIRSFCPGYEEMLGVLAGAVAGPVPDGSSTLAQAAGRCPRPYCGQAAMSASSSWTRIRICCATREFGWRALEIVPRLRRGPFLDALPRCDAAVASVSLHHVRSLKAKRALYAGIQAALEEGGIFLNGDAAVPASGAARKAAIHAWTEHMGTCGIDAEGARANLEAWSSEDTYFSLPEELDALQRAGFEADCIWRCGPMAVIAGWKA